MRTNRMKAKLRSGEPVFGLSVMIPSPQLVEMAAGLGFDWVLLDCEHGTIALESLELMIVAAEASGITPIVRPRSRDAGDILQVMDRGAAGVQIPHVNSAADARDAVAAVKFHPQGRRSLAVGTRASRYGLGLSLSDYVAAANRESLVCVQIEDEAALPNVEEMLKVDGVDVFFIGPSDLSQSMGYPGNPKAEPVAKAIENTLEKIIAAGKTPGMPAGAEAVRATVARGVRYIYTHVPNLMAVAASAYLKAARG